MRGIDDREREHRLLLQSLLRERPGTHVRQLLELHQHLLFLRYHLCGNSDAVPPLRLRDDPHHLTPAPHCPIDMIRQGRSYKGSAVFGRPDLRISADLIAGVIPRWEQCVSIKRLRRSGD